MAVFKIFKCRDSYFLYMKPITHILHRFNRKQKSLVAVILLIIVIGLSSLIFFRERGGVLDLHSVSDSGSDNQRLDAIAQAHIMNDTYFTTYDGYDLRLSTVERPCADCMLLTYSFNINTSLLVKSIKGFTAVVELKNETVVSSRYIRLT